VRWNEICGVEFEEMQRLPILFSCRPTFSGVVDKVNEKLRWTGTVSILY
jgi:hypothetical protein